VILKNIRRFDVQARFALALSVFSVAPMSGAVFLAYRRYHHELAQIIYRQGSLFLPIFGALIMLSMAPSALGMLLGWSSAGQRRNETQAKSWTGFFLGGTVLTLDLILGIAFWMLRLSQPA
jgi:hypothetical protein